MDSGEFLLLFLLLFLQLVLKLFELLLLVNEFRDCLLLSGPFHLLPSLSSLVLLLSVFGKSLFAFIHFLGLYCGVSSTGSIFGGSCFAFLSWDSEGIIEYGNFHSLSYCVLFETIGVRNDIGVGGGLEDFFCFEENWFDVFTGYFEVLDLLLLFLLVVHVDLEGSLVHRFGLLGSLLEVVCLAEEVVGRGEFLLLDAKS